MPAADSTSNIGFCHSLGVAEGSGSQRNVRVLTLAVLVAAGICTSCLVVPVPHKTVHGPQFETSLLDLSFLREGLTRREDVDRRLSVLDTGAGSPRLFWGRWTKSITTYWVAVGYLSAGGGQADYWRRNNILIAFDSAGVAKRVIRVGDSGLLEALAREVPKTRDPATRIPGELELTTLGSALAGAEKLTVSGGKVHFSGSEEGEPRWECSIDKIKALRIHSESDTNSSDHLRFRLSTTIPTNFGRGYSRSFELRPEDSFALVEFILNNGLGRLLSGGSQD